MGNDWQQSEFPMRGFPTVGEYEPDNPLRSIERPAAEEFKIRRNAVRHHLGEEIPEIPHRRSVELTLDEDLIKFRERIPELRVETPQYMSTYGYEAKFNGPRTMSVSPPASGIIPGGPSP